MIAVFVTVKVKPERLDDFLEAIEEDARGSREDEPGCLRFDVLRDAEDQNTFYFYEIYRDAEAQKAHRTMPHYQGWLAIRDGGGLQEPPKIVSTTTVFPRDDHAQWKK